MADATPSTPYGSPYFSSVKADNIDPQSNIGEGSNAVPLSNVADMVTGAGKPNGVAKLDQDAQLTLQGKSALGITPATAASGATPATPAKLKPLLPLDETATVGNDGTTLGDIKTVSASVQDMAPSVAKIPDMQNIIYLSPTPQATSENARLLFSNARHTGMPMSDGKPLTFGTNFAVAAPFFGIKLIFVNYNTSPLVIQAASVAASANNTDFSAPKNADGTDATWFPVSVNGVSSNITLPAAPSADLPSYTLSDIIPLQSIPRNDNGAGFLIYTRQLSLTTSWNAANLKQGGTGGNDNENQPNLDNFNAGLGDWTVQSFYAKGDYTTIGKTKGFPTSGSDISAFDSNSALFIVAGAVFYTLEQCVTIACAGDSLWQGYLSNGSWGSFGRQAVQALNKNGIKASFCDLGWSGQIASQVNARVKAFLDLGISPHIFGIMSDSPNDFYKGLSGALSEATSVSFSMDAMSTAAKNGSFVFTTTPLPWSSPEGAASTRYPTADLLRANNPVGVSFVLDSQKILCGSIPTVANPGSVISAYRGRDGNHYNGTGQAALAAGLLPFLKQAVTNIFSVKTGVLP